MDRSQCWASDRKGLMFLTSAACRCEGLFACAALWDQGRFHASSIFARANYSLMLTFGRTEAIRCLLKVILRCL